MKISAIIFLNIFFFMQLYAQQNIPPIEKNNYQKVTSYNELTDFVRQLD